MTESDVEQRLIEMLIEFDRGRAERVDGECESGNLPSTELNDESESVFSEFQQACSLLTRLQRHARRNQSPFQSDSRGAIDEQNADMAAIASTCQEREEIASNQAPPIPGVARNSIPETIGRFRILRQLGAGGFGIVFRAHDPMLNRDVALKILRPESLLARDARVRFERESQLAAALKHPAIVPVHETGVDGPIRFIVFQYLPSDTLEDWLERQSEPVNPYHAAELMLRVTDAVASAHSRGILHRDLKPGNLLVEKDEPNVRIESAELAERIHIADFGLAIDLDQNSTLTQTGTMVGTPVYIAPELVTGKDKPTMASDVYSLGVILYELLAGKRPFESDSGLQLLRAIVEDTPPRIRGAHNNGSSIASASRKRISRVPRDLEAICFKCLQKNPAHRYLSAGELHRDLLSWQSGGSVTASPVTFWSQIIRSAARKPLIAGLLATLATLVIAFAVIGSWAAVELARRNNNLQDAYFESLVSHSRLTRQSIMAGRRESSLGAIRSAAKLLSGTANDEPRQLLLRNEVIASMSQLDVRMAARITATDLNLVSNRMHDIAFDTDLKLVAWPIDNGQIAVTNLNSRRRCHTISTDGEWVRQLLFVPDRKWICAVVQFENQSKLMAWQLHASEQNKHVELAFELEGVSPEFRINCSHDGQNIACLSNDHRVLLVDLDSGKSRQLPGLENNSKAEGASFSPRDDQIAIWYGSQVAVWDVTQPEIPRAPQHHFELSFNRQCQITSASWSHFNERLATTTSVFTTHLWSPVWGESRHKELAGHTGWVYQAIFSPSQRLLATSSSDDTTRFWDAESGELLMITEGRVLAVNSLGTKMAGVQSGDIVVWDVLTPQFRREWTCSDESCTVEAITGQSSRDGKYLAYCNADWMSIYDLHNEKQIWWEPVRCGQNSAFSGNGEFGFAINTDRLFRIRLQDGEATELLLDDLYDGIKHETLSVSYDGTLASVELRDGPAFVDVETGKTFPCRPHPPELGSVCFHPNQPWYAIAVENGIEIWNYETDSQEQVIGDATYSHPLHFDSTGTYLVMHANHRPALLNLNTKRLELFASDPARLHRDDVSFSSDGKFIAVTGFGKSLNIYRLLRQQSHFLQSVARIPVGTDLTWVAFSDDQQLITSGPDHRMNVWSIGEVRQRLAELGLNWSD